MAGGHAEPPITVRLSDENRTPASRMWVSKPSHTVGTPAEYVTRSLSINSYSDLPSRSLPGNTSFAPVNGAACGMPHAFTWNIGTTGSTASRADRLIASGKDAPNACSTVERCEYSAPFGLPVVPDV